MIPIISDASDLLLPPAKIIVKCVCGPLSPNFCAAALERSLVLEPVSRIASISTSLPFEFSTLIFLNWKQSCYCFDISVKFE